MDTPHGLSLTLSWGASGASTRRSLPLGLPLRVGAVLALCAACYQVGRWHGGLEAAAARPALRYSVARAVAAPVAATVASELRAGGTGMAPGQAAGEEADVITPLRVRDPSALVMGPAFNPLPPPAPAAQPETEEPPPTPRARVFPGPSSRLKPDRRF